MIGGGWGETCQEATADRAEGQSRQADSLKTSSVVSEFPHLIYSLALPKMLLSQFLSVKVQCYIVS